MGRRQFARTGVLQLGDHLVHHCHKVGGAAGEDRGAELTNHYQGGYLRLLQQVGQLTGAVGGVDVHQHRADLGGGKLAEGPLGVVGSPNRHVLAPLDAQGHEPASDPIHLSAELRVGVSRPGFDVHEGIAVAETLGLLIQNVAYGAAGIDRTGHGVPPHSVAVEDPASNVEHEAGQHALA